MEGQTVSFRGYDRRFIHPQREASGECLWSPRKINLHLVFLRGIDARRSHRQGSASNQCGAGEGRGQVVHKLRQGGAIRSIQEHTWLWD